MRPVVLAIAVLLGPQAEAASDTGLCGSIASAAAAAMAAHQKAVPLETVLGHVEKQTEAIRPTARLIILNAYRTPRYSTAEMQQRAVAGYRDQVHIACLDALNR